MYSHFLCYSTTSPKPKDIYYNIWHRSCQLFFDQSTNHSSCTLILNFPATGLRWTYNHKHMVWRQYSQLRFSTIHLTTIKQLSQGWSDRIKVMGNHISRAPCGSLSSMIMRSTEDGGTYLINGNIIAYSKWRPPAERHYDYYCDPSLSCCWERLASGRTWVMRTAWIRRLQLLFIRGCVKDGCFGIRIEGDNFNHSRINTSIKESICLFTPCT